MHGGVWISAVVAGFLFQPPPILPQEGASPFYRLGMFIAAALVGLFFIPAHFRSRKRDARLWWIVATTSLVIAVGSFVIYVDVWRSHSAECIAGRRITGREAIYADLNPHGVSLQRKQSSVDLSRERLLEMHACDPTQVWKRTSLDRSQQAIERLYLVCLIIFALSAMAIVQGVYCLRTPGKQHK